MTVPGKSQSNACAIQPEIDRRLSLISDLAGH